jgi:perosamine synthetase
MWACGVGAGDEVICPGMTYWASCTAALSLGAAVNFADIERDSLCIDPKDIEHRIGKRTRAIIAVHYAGYPCDMDAIMRIAARKKVPVIEDCAQACCTTYRGKFVGTFGAMACFSFQQSKHLPTGDGGMTLTSDAGYGKMLGLMRDKGWENRESFGPRTYTHLALNYRMSELTAAVGRAQLRKVEGVVKAMNRMGNLLTSLISDLDGIMPAPATPGGEHSYWLYPYKVTGYDPKALVAALAAEGVPTRWGYTVLPIYLCTEALAAKKTLGSSNFPFIPTFTSRSIDYRLGMCPVAESDLPQIGTFRIFENWTEAEVRDVADAFRKVAAGLKRR